MFYPGQLCPGINGLGGPIMLNINGPPGPLMPGPNQNWGGYMKDY